MNTEMSGARINIGGQEDDKFFRYRMPPIQPKVEGRGNGIKTRIVNCSTIAKCLKRRPGYLCKFFGCELGAQTTINEPEDKYIVNGAFEQKVLAELVTKFIELFVLCSQCKQPETDLVVSKKGLITQECKACGMSSMCDMTHKLCNYILNNPPDDNMTNPKKAKRGMDKKERRQKKAERATGLNEEEEEADTKQEKKSKKKREGETEEEAAERRARRRERKKKKEAGEAEKSEDSDDVEWSMDTSEAAVAARLKEAETAAALLQGTKVSGSSAKADQVSEGMEQLSLNGKAQNGGSHSDDDDVDEDADVQRFKEAISEAVENGKALKGKALAETALGISRSSLDEDAEQGVVVAHAAGLIMDTFLNTSTALEPVKLVKRIVPALKGLSTIDEPLAQIEICNRMDRLCESIEDMHENEEDEFEIPEEKVVAQLLKAFFDNEVVGSSAMSEWYERESYSSASSRAREVAKPVIEYMLAEEEGEDDD
ncbi:Eukaryotic translation initiation factor 5 [Porphyridium purpureum]|uniref:Eukaryotic translation initiation factor 5 n=1 Tax=Porphyridium purpureum TaxID=35688 RepID=A0A5J4YZ78_PORPP|nr:Eukaryotic translation initiation factor 5 [Porphyridium purpureum]|eukprot:POR8455..scf209_3